MIPYLARRLAWAVFVVSLVTTAVFFLVYAAGDPAALALGSHAGPRQIADFKRKHGLDRPIVEQYGTYLGVLPCRREYAPDDPEKPSSGYCGLLQGDLGRSYLYNEPVSGMIASRLPRTLLLGAMAMVFELVIGLGAGILAALRRDRWLDTFLVGGTVLGASLPTFVTGPVALFVLAFLCGLFPVGGYGTGALDHLRHGVLPALVLAIAGASSYTRLMRGELIETLEAPYVRTARAKGVSPLRVVLHHAVRNALLPIVTVLGLSLPMLVSGAIITEYIFNWPGIGRMAIEAINNLDAPIILAVVLMSSLAVQIGNLLADLAIAALDPRVRDR